MENEKIMVFIPMYNCENQINRVLSKFSLSLQKRFAEIVVVDNRSADRSREVASEVLSKLTYVKTTLLQNCENYSLGGSHKVAFNYALDSGYDFCIVLHGDDQGNIEDLVPYLDSGIHRQFDSLLGSRFAHGSKLVGYSAFRTYGNILFNLGISLFTGRWITDMGSGLNVYKTDYLRDRFYLYFPNDLTFNVFMLYYGIYAKSSFKFFPLTWREEDQVSNAKIFRQAAIIAGLTGRYLIDRKRLFAKTENEFSRINYASEVLYRKEPVENGEQ